MEPTTILAAARNGLADMAERYAQLVEAQDDTSIALPGSAWTVRDAAAHLASNSRRYAGLVKGDLDISSLPLDKEFLDARARSLIAANPETDPRKLANQIRDGVDELLRATTTVPADQTIVWYTGLRLDAAGIVALYLGEPLLHGYDIATAVGVSWPIDPEYAALSVSAYRLVYPAIFQPSAAGLDATYRIDIAGAEPFSVRIAGGTYEEVPGDPDVDCVISADPVTALMVISGRLSRWPAIALGGLRFAGDSEIGPRFFDLFVFP